MYELIPTLEDMEQVYLRIFFVRNNPQLFHVSFILYFWSL